MDSNWCCVTFLLIIGPQDFLKWMNMCLKGPMSRFVYLPLANTSHFLFGTSHWVWLFPENWWVAKQSWSWLSVLLSNRISQLNIIHEISAALSLKHSIERRLQPTYSSQGLWYRSIAGYIIVIYHAIFPLWVGLRPRVLLDVCHTNLFGFPCCVLLPNCAIVNDSRHKYETAFGLRGKYV